MIPVTFLPNPTIEGSTLKISPTTNYRNNTEFVADGDKNGESGKRTEPTKVDKNNPHKRIDELLRCEPNEKPWDVIYFDGHGPMEIKSINGCTYAYYFRSRKGGAVIVKGVKNKDQFPWVFEEVIKEVKSNRGFSPKKVMCDNARQHAIAGRSTD